MLGSSKTAESYNFDATLLLAKKGDVRAMYCVAELYSEGTDTTRNECSASLWFLRAAKAGMVTAMYEVARRHLLGEGIAKDVDECQTWLRKAYAADHLLMPELTVKRTEPTYSLSLTMELIEVGLVAEKRRANR